MAISLLLFAGCAATPPPQNNGPSGGAEQQTPSGKDDENMPNETPSDKEDDSEEITKMYITVNDNKLEITLANNSSADALVALLKRGDITFTATENGGFEIYGSIGQPLPTNNQQITAEVGDVLLYAGSYLCIFFGGNSYSYTRIGKINGYTMSELRSLLGADQASVQVTISLK